jgi:drug/metabolite transporter (DMT)-like permease
MASIFIQSFSFLSLKVSTVVANDWSLVLLVLAFLFMGIRAVLWQSLLRGADLSRVYPFTSLVQVLIFLYAVALFGEKVELNNVIGLFLMLLGAFFLSREGEFD